MHARSQDKLVAPHIEPSALNRQPLALEFATPPRAHISWHRHAPCKGESSTRVLVEAFECDFYVDTPCSSHLPTPDVGYTAHRSTAAVRAAPSTTLQSQPIPQRPSYETRIHTLTPGGTSSPSMCSRHRTHTIGVRNGIRAALSAACAFPTPAAVIGRLEPPQPRAERGHYYYCTHNSQDPNVPDARAGARRAERRRDEGRGPLRDCQRRTSTLTTLAAAPTSISSRSARRLEYVSSHRAHRKLLRFHSPFPGAVDRERMEVKTPPSRDGAGSTA
ncbi:hypothetical protein B0H13DRAFT_2341944 [Mycena leptocephala]|nr:hypothetical protein B0H13DRAFT_2341944 [Mycena leptocephala]